MHKDRNKADSSVVGACQVQESSIMLAPICTTQIMLCFVCTVILVTGCKQGHHTLDIKLSKVQLNALEQLGLG